VGALIRRIGVATRPGEARAAVEDDFHHFRVVIRHDGARVTGTAWQALRRPWTTCALAGERLSELVGMELSPRANAVIAHTDQRQQCTHMFDLAGLAIAATARGIKERRYEAVVPDRFGPRTDPHLVRDGAEVLRWTLEGSLITAPAPFAGQSLQAGFSKWAEENLDADEAEAALVLRRAAFISGGRGVNLDAAPHAPARGGCYVQQPQRAPAAKRMVGSTQDFTDRPDSLLEGDARWLAFET
jgi:hypothetical protein